MKKLVICVAVLAMVWTSSAMAAPAPVYVGNAGFEQPAVGVDGKIKGFDGVVSGYPDDVPSWYDDCPSGVLNRSGVKGANKQYVRTGDQGANLCPSQPGTIPENIVWQLTDQIISAGETYTLSVWSRAGGVAAGIDVVLDVSLFYDDGAGNHTEVASKEYTLSETVAQACPVDFIVGTEGLGKKLGIQFENLTEYEASGWLHLDDVTLNVVPEPATMMLLGLGSLALLKRRRA